MYGYKDKLIVKFSGIKLHLKHIIYLAVKSDQMGFKNPNEYQLNIRIKILSVNFKQSDMNENQF